MCVWWWLQHATATRSSAGPELHVWASGRLLQTLMASDLVDERRLWVCPVVLVEGKRLFEEGLPARRLSLVASQQTPTSVLLNTYRRA